ncbi:MAG: GNAT family N-acetyltransferase [Proteobacteria bacterium]|nr:MAG: GNAT family N-acetyltransferase [Pseudomonadota bacterium]
MSLAVQRRWNGLKWQCSAFEQLSSSELYEVLRLRQEVFIVEQNCPYLDADGTDRSSYHLLGWSEEDKRLVAYARLVKPGIKYAEASIGRVVTSSSARGTGCGKLLVAEAIVQIKSLCPGIGIRISAQQYLERFYKEFGFETVSPPYDEDGIPHIEMLWRAK